MWESNHCSFPQELNSPQDRTNTRKGTNPYPSHFFLRFLSRQWKSSSFLHCAHSDLCPTALLLSSPCQGRWGGPWKTLWRLVVGGSQGVWWPFHYSRSLPFHACPFPPSFPAEHLHRKGKYIAKGEVKGVKLPTAVQRNSSSLQKQGKKINIFQLVWV